MRRIIIAAALLATTAGMAQQSFTLQEAMDYSATHSYNVQLSEFEVQSALAKVNETIGTGLPQVTANASYQNFLKQPVQVVPAEFFGGQPGEFQSVVFGTEQNLSADITATQLIFDGSYLVGLKAATEVSRLFELQKKKSVIDVKKDVSDAYFMVLVAKKSSENLKEGLTVLEKLKTDRRAMYKEGFASETDADQLDIDYNRLKNNADYADVQYKLALLLLKFRLGIPQDDTLILSDQLSTYTENLAVLQSSIDLKTTVTFELAEQNVTLQGLNRKALQAQYLPSLNGFFTHQQQSFSNEFNFFGSDATYYPSTFFGINLKVPIFSSLSKHHKIKQAKIEEFKAKLNATMAQESISLEYSNAEANLTYNFSTFKNQELNLELAKKIRRKTLIKFEEGLATSFEVSQSEQQFLEAQNAYTQATLSYLQSVSTLKQVTNQF